MNEEVMSMPMKDWENVKKRYQEVVDQMLKLEAENRQLREENERLKTTYINSLDCHSKEDDL